MNKPELTPWFDCVKQPPERLGVYEIRCIGGSGAWFSYWAGTHWGLTTDSPARAFNVRHQASRDIYTRAGEWRGYTTRQETRS